MLWCYEVDIVTLGLILQLQHEVGDLGGLQVPALLLLGDVPVLTEDTAEVAESEEDGPGSIPSLQHGLLAEVREGGADHSQAAGVTGSLLVLKTGNTPTLPLQEK